MRTIKKCTAVCDKNERICGILICFIHTVYNLNRFKAYENIESNLNFNAPYTKIIEYIIL